ncbi:hypothetical protein M3B80_011850 [Micrococcus luteus]|uniref:hypothetical protein n=1 Tax=Micrococcus luteus TaxID=1270 RepID=UPI00352E833C|nr:hypothetical protein [Micrococcus luteus]MCV7546176.1 hypothetical protein [Micrococcus luteus]MCV7552950.1 hypothetical protein [Micrococcus luteus]MCV7751310.1 hypothetical protein [Micrococcus luteus]
MTTRPAYSDADVRRFMALARGGRERPDALQAAMDRHPAGKARTTTGVRDLTRRGPIPRDLPPLTNADGSPSEPLPALTPEDR